MEWRQVRRRILNEEGGRYPEQRRRQEKWLETPAEIIL